MRIIKFITAFVMLLALSGCYRGIEQANQSKIAVRGIGTVTAEPDMVEISLAVNHVAGTTQEAQKEVSVKINELLKIFEETGINKNEIRTSSLTFSAEYEYGGGKNIYIGQKSEQSMVVIINNINRDREIFPNFIHRITGIDRLVLRNIRFDVKDKTAMFVKSRELACQKALEKARQYAELSGLRIVKVLSVSENESREYFPMAQNRIMAYGGGDFEGASMYDDVSIPAGEIEISSHITVEYLLK